MHAAHLVDDERSLHDAGWFDLEPGALPRLVAGRYLLAERIGSGGFGSVFCAHDRVLDEWIAMKALAPALLHHPGARRKLIREARLARRVTHRNVLRVHGLVVDQDALYLTMEHVAGPTLGQRIDAEGSLRWAETVRIGAQLADGLQAVHDAGILHCDVKCDNVAQDTTGRPVRRPSGRRSARL